MAHYQGTMEKIHQAMDAVASYGSIAAAARQLGIPRKTLANRYNQGLKETVLAETQALAGYAAANPTLIATPPSNAIPEGQQLRGLSTRVDETGGTDQQWVKTERASGE